MKIFKEGRREMSVKRLFSMVLTLVMLLTLQRQNNVLEYISQKASHSSECGVFLCVKARFMIELKKQKKLWLRLRPRSVLLWQRKFSVTVRGIYG